MITPNVSQNPNDSHGSQKSSHDRPKLKIKLNRRHNQKPKTKPTNPTKQPNNKKNPNPASPAALARHLHEKVARQRARHLVCLLSKPGPAAHSTAGDHCKPDTQFLCFRRRQLHQWQPVDGQSLPHAQVDYFIFYSMVCNIINKLTTRIYMVSGGYPVGRIPI